MRRLLRRLECILIGHVWLSTRAICLHCGRRRGIDISAWGIRSFRERHRKPAPPGQYSGTVTGLEETPYGFRVTVELDEEK